MEDAPSRKRLRRSTRSCYQCRKRKVKCQLTDENVDTCAECVKSGTQCSLEPPKVDMSSGRTITHDNTPENESRLERIESLLQRLVVAQERSKPAEDSFDFEPTVPTSLWNDFLLQSTTDASFPLNDHGLAMPQTPDQPDAKQSLVALLPSSQDAVSIVTNTTAWLWGAENPPGSVLNPNDTVQLLDVPAISRGSAMHIAKTLLLFALYIQQLPASFDAQFLGSQSIEKTIELIVERVKMFVLSHDDEACSMDGIECLTLLSSIQLNDGALRTTWVTFRRVLDIARLKGFQNSFSLSARNSSSSETALHRRLWLSTVCGDCYCSMLVGLEPGLGLAPFGPDDDTWNDPHADNNANIQRRICLIVARIAQRNAVGLYQDRSILQEVDEALDKTQDSVPASWWKNPSFPQDRSLDSAQEPSRVICQLWFFQARIYAHIPIAFGKPSSDSLYSLETCIEACRITLHRYLGLQHARDQLSRCRSVDQSTFVAAVVLLLAKVQLRHRQTNLKASRYDSDHALLEQVMDTFEMFGKASNREHTVRESFEILSTMLDISSDTSENVFTTNSLSDPNTPLLLGSDVAVASAPGTMKSGMEDIVASSILPALDAQSPASHLINRMFTARKSDSGVLKPTQELSDGNWAFNLNDLIDPTTLK
ncbi:hypothetical protein AK830_g7024 [Neonectria ditissima]|uniref:Zn(2)-C6 fungal-type domain-containing protein n=1 Tax=Neonectria ditissima TaxID=78410 RepID=A0A0P7AY46_9HYPO|nr:hypothetical protein AK830_g7024 [Neonectria ditissima]